MTTLPASAWPRSTGVALLVSVVPSVGASGATASTTTAEVSPTPLSVVSSALPAWSWVPLPASKEVTLMPPAPMSPSTTV